MEKEESTYKNFIEQIIDKDLEEGKTDKIITRFPPEPNGYLHIGHAKSIFLNYGIAQEYNGTFNLRFDDTNPGKEKDEYVDAILSDINWLGVTFDGDVKYASNYFEKMYDAAVTLIKKGKAYVCDLTAEEIREYRGTLTEPGKESPYRNRSVEENLDLFERMKNGEFADGEKVLRAKIDMASPNINMRDPVIYRVAHLTHHRTGDKWCIYPMYDFAHPLEDAFEGITHSLCTLEFEDHRPLYDWCVNEVGFEKKPQQIEFAKLRLKNVVTGKRYIKRLVENGDVDGWDDPRLVSISALRRRGYTPESIREFTKLAGVTKVEGEVELPMLEFCIREDLKPKCNRMMAILDPVKVVIDNYPEDKEEMLTIPNNIENEELGERSVPFSREIYIEREDFMEEPPKKYFRLYPGNEVRLMNAYFVTCTDIEKDENGNITLIHCTYDPESKGGNSPDGRKVKGTVHWVSAKHAKSAEIRLYDNIIDEEKGVFAEDGSINVNKDSLIVINNAMLEPELMNAKAEDRFQFVRNGYFVCDLKDSKEGQPVFNRIVSLKSSFKL
ncbi:MAG: glutamine--tRNA ligase/YqeY domain fusion protein [Lachnospiraceae bacterium]|nr:glutamine--tRNA ligase/YqeY domain fusion protein [Lachnospiraceae bacterium]